jgi:methylenetetrahydrofolate dehydrogenase (NADP+) / methenyltetrahydrofolate cyclohydrolase
MDNITYLYGKEVSESIFRDLKKRISLLDKKDVKPALAVILIGDNPASELYVRSKTRTFKRLNLYSKIFKLPKETSEKEVLKLIIEINQNSNFHGLLIQLPLPRHIDKEKIIFSINPEKDVDGFHPINAGLLSIGKPKFIPCTPKGIMKILEYYKVNLNGKNVVVLGRSNIVGRPVSILISSKTKYANATTTICHSGTLNIKRFTKNADVIIVALGIPKFLKADMVKENSIIIDVGINRIKDQSVKGYSIIGDADLLDLKKKNIKITPVPGGVGPMTISMLVENTVESAENYCARSSVG